MSDIHCPTCGEPWDAYYLRHDLPYEGGEPELIEDVLRAGKRPLDVPEIRDQLALYGWQFSGSSMLGITRCACCPKDTTTSATERISTLCDLLDHDEDGLQAELEDLS